MDYRTLKRLMADEKFLEQRIQSYMQKRLLNESSEYFEIKGHLEKSRHSLDFLIEIDQRFNDWALIVCYYAAYHAALALIISKVYNSKSHDATLCILIKEFYDLELSRDEIELLNAFDTEDILFYAESKSRREEASYSTKRIFSHNTVNMMRIKTKFS